MLREIVFFFLSCSWFGSVRGREVDDGEPFVKCMVVSLMIGAEETDEWVWN